MSVEDQLKCKQFLSGLRPAIVAEFNLLLTGQKHLITNAGDELKAVGCEYDSTDFEIVVYSLSISDQPNSVLDYKKIKMVCGPRTTISTVGNGTLNF